MEFVVGANRNSVWAKRCCSWAASIFRNASTTRSSQLGLACRKPGGHMSVKIASWEEHLSWLVVDLPLWKISKSVGMIIPNIWKNEKFSKPPTSKGNGFSRLARRPCLPITPSWFVLCCVAAQCFQCMCHAALLNWQQKTSKNTCRRNRLKMGRLFQCNFMKPSGS